MECQFGRNGGPLVQAVSVRSQQRQKQPIHLQLRRGKPCIQFGYVLNGRNDTSIIKLFSLMNLDSVISFKIISHN